MNTILLFFERMMNVVLLSFVVLVMSACTSDNDFQTGKRQLEAMGYTDVVNTGHEYFCCSKDDQYSTGFEAKDKFGNTVTGCFCSQNFKGVTIRFE